MFIIIGIIFIGYQWIKYIMDNAYIRDKHRAKGFEVYRGVDGTLYKTSTGNKLTIDEINKYYHVK